MHAKRNGPRVNTEETQRYFGDKTNLGNSTLLEETNFVRTAMPLSFKRFGHATCAKAALGLRC